MLFEQIDVAISALENAKYLLVKQCYDAHGSYRETAKQLGIPYNTVRKYLSKKNSRSKVIHSSKKQNKRS